LRKPIDISDRYKERIYELDYCKGCSRELAEGEEFTEITLPDAIDSKKVTHIALCNKCSKEADEHGAFD